jgi:hypothetical protein
MTDERRRELERAYAMFLGSFETPPAETDYPFGRLQGLGDAYIEIQLLLEEPRT